MNDRIHVNLQKEYALDMGYPVWGFSPASNPEGGYGEYDVPMAGSKGYEGPVVTPHASFLALYVDPGAVCDNIRKMTELFDVYGDYGFYDSVNVITGEVAYRYLCLDQAMIFIAINNFLNNGAVRNRFMNSPEMKKAKKILAYEKFNISDN